MIATDPSGNTNDTVLKRLDRWAEERPNKTALLYLVNGETELAPVSYAQLQRSARSIATELLRRDAGGKCALLLYQPGLEFATSFLACLYAGVIAIPVYAPKTNRNQNRLTSIIEDSSAAFAFSTQSELQRWRDNNLGGESLAALHWLATDTIDGDSDLAQIPEIPGNNIALLQYSSGSTGTPKGVMVSHANLAHNLQFFAATQRSDEHSVSVSWLPIFHDMGLVFGLLFPIAQGITCVLMPPAAFTQKPIRWLRAMSKYRGTHSAAPNFAYDLCVHRTTVEDREGLDLSSWRTAISGAEPVRKATLDEFSQLFKNYGFDKRSFCPGYGLAEATLAVTVNTQEQAPSAVEISVKKLEHNQAIASSSGTEPTHTIASCGATGLDMEFKIVDPGSLQVLPDGEVGEIWTRSPSVCQGYWNKPEETERTFRALLAGTTAPYYLRTGDLGFTIDRHLYVTGRIKDLIIVRGRNIYPQDVEFTAEQHGPALRPGFGAAFSVTVQGEEQLVVAYEVERTARLNRPLDKERIIDDLRTAILDEFKIRVHDVVLLKTGSISKTTSGKIQRAACRSEYLAGTLEVIARHLRPVATLDGDDSDRPDEIMFRTVSIISTFIWQIFGRQVFVTPESRIQADLGLDSLDVTVLIAKLEKELTLTVDVERLHAVDTVQDLIAVIKSNGPASGTNSSDPSAESGHGNNAMMSSRSVALMSRR